MKDEEEQRREKIIVCKHEIFTQHYQGELKSMSFYRFLNRILMYVQETVVLAVTENTVIPGTRIPAHKLIYHTMQDPWWRAAFESDLRESDRIQNKAELFEDHLYFNDDPDLITFKLDNIGSGATHHLMFFRSEFQKGENVPPRFSDLSSEHRDDRLCRDIHALIEDWNDDPRIQQIYTTRTMVEKIRVHAKKWRKGHMITAHRESWEELISFDNNTYLRDKSQRDDFFKEHILKLHQVFNQQYEDAFESQLIRSDPDKVLRPPNIFFGIRVFDRDQLRYTDSTGSALYNYGIYDVVTPSQQKDILRCLRRLATLQNFEHSRRRDKFFYFSPYKNDSGSRKYEARLRISGPNDDFFWDLLQSPLGRKEIISYITGFKMSDKTTPTPIDQQTRTIYDPIFASGLSHIAHTPFPTDGNGRLPKSEWHERNAERLTRDCKRLICNYYILSLLADPLNDSLESPLAHETKGKMDHSILMIPGFVGGSPYFTASFMANYQRKDDDGGFKTWQNSFYFYTAVFQSIQGRLRRRIRDVYLEQVANMYEESIVVAMTSSLGKKDQSDYILDRVEHDLNHRLEALTRIYPFKQIRVQLFKENKSEYYYFSAKIFDHIQIDIETVPNKYFPEYMNVDALGYLKNVFKRADGSTYKRFYLDSFEHIEKNGYDPLEA